MPINNISRSMRAKQEPGRHRIIGRLGKGEIVNGKPVDRDYFVFTPWLDDKQNKELSRLFTECYGEKPVRVDDVRFPEVMAGNFDMGATTWYRAESYQKHGGGGKKKTILIAESDGVHIRRMRDEDTGRVEFLDPPEPHTPEGVMYMGRLIEWKEKSWFDITLFSLNDAIHEHNANNHLNRLPLGVVRFNTSSINDIGRLEDEFYGCLDNVFGAFRAVNGDVPGYSRDRIDLTIIPFSLYRKSETVGVPSFRKGAKRGERMFQEKSFVHLELEPGFQHELHSLRRNAASQLLAAPPQRLLSDVSTAEEVDDLLFGDGASKTMVITQENDDYEPAEIAESEIVDDNPMSDTAEYDELISTITDRKTLFEALSQTGVFSNISDVTTVISRSNYQLTDYWENDFNAIMALAIDEELPF